VTIRERVARNLRKYRKAAGLTQVEAAERLGIPHTNISRWERGINSISPENIEKVARVYGVDPGQFFENDDENEPEQIWAVTESLEALPVF